jgi:hypothetical protein
MPLLVKHRGIGGFIQVSIVTAIKGRINSRALESRFDLNEVYLKVGWGMANWRVEVGVKKSFETLVYYE